MRVGGERLASLSRVGESNGTAPSVTKGKIFCGNLSSGGWLVGECDIKLSLETASKTVESRCVGVVGSILWLTATCTVLNMVRFTGFEGKLS